MAKDQREPITKEMIQKKMLADLKGSRYLMIGTSVFAVFMGAFISILFSVAEPNAWWLLLIMWIFVAFAVGGMLALYFNRRRVAIKGQFFVVRDTVADMQVEIVRRHTRRGVRHKEEHVLYFTTHGRCVVSEGERYRTSVGDGFFLVLSVGKKPAILMRFAERAYRLDLPILKD